LDAVHGFAMNRIFFALQLPGANLKNRRFPSFLDCQPRFDLRRYIRPDIALVSR